MFERTGRGRGRNRTKGGTTCSVEVGKCRSSLGGDRTDSRPLLVGSIFALALSESGWWGTGGVHQVCDPGGGLRGDQSSLAQHSHRPMRRSSRSSIGGQGPRVTPLYSALQRTPQSPGSANPHRRERRSGEGGHSDSAGRSRRGGIGFGREPHTTATRPRARVRATGSDPYWAIRLDGA